MISDYEKCGPYLQWMKARKKPIGTLCVGARAENEISREEM
jgi:hypothetical protein